MAVPRTEAGKTGKVGCGRKNGRIGSREERHRRKDGGDPTQPPHLRDKRRCERDRVRHDRVRIARGLIEPRIIRAERRQKNFPDQRVCTMYRVEQPIDRHGVVRIDHRSHRAEVEAERLDKRSVIFRGREYLHAELGKALLDKLATEVGEIGQVERPPVLEGRRMSMVLAPK